MGHLLKGQFWCCVEAVLLRASVEQSPMRELVSMSDDGDMNFSGNRKNR